MTPDKLRALADALDNIIGNGWNELLSLGHAINYLHTCADAEPVGYVTANGLRSLRQDDATVLLYAHDYLIRPDHVALYTHPAPAAPKVEPHTDDAAVDRFAAAMKVKLAEKRKQGKAGWDDPAVCTTEFLADMLREHIAKGDPLDVGNLAMMLWCRGGSTNETQAEQYYCRDHGCSCNIGDPIPEPEPKRPHIEVSLDPHDGYWRVALCVGVQEFEFADTWGSPGGAESYAKRLRKALGITGDSND